MRSGPDVSSASQRKLADLDFLGYRLHWGKFLVRPCDFLDRLGRRRIQSALQRIEVSSPEFVLAFITVSRVYAAVGLVEQQIHVLRTRLVAALRRQLAMLIELVVEDMQRLVGMLLLINKHLAPSGRRLSKSQLFAPLQVLQRSLHRQLCQSANHVWLGHRTC